MRTKGEIALALAVLILLILPSCASAEGDPGALEFMMGIPTTGTIEYVAGFLAGIDIQVDTIYGWDTPLNADEDGAACINCLLNFQTGPVTGSWTFGGGDTSFISIVGGVDFGGNPADNIAPGTTLLYGQFGTAFIDGDSSLKTVYASFADVLNPALATHYGLPAWDDTGHPFREDGSLSFSFGDGSSPPEHIVSSTMYGGDLVTSPVPEPFSIVLLGTVLLGCALLVRRARRTN